jgi:hypothetical protein
MFGRNVWQTADINETIRDLAAVIRPARKSAVSDGR